MSLLLSARENAGPQDLDAETSAPSIGAQSNDKAPNNNGARAAEQNLFGAEAPDTFPVSARINRDLLLALAGAATLLAAGGGYLWFATSYTPPVARAPVQAPAIPQPISEPLPTSSAMPALSTPRPARISPPTPAARPPARMIAQHARGGSASLHLEQHLADSIDPLLSRAYESYRVGKFEQAQQLYLQVHRIDERNSDALLGLAAIAQRDGADDMAAHYYAKVLELNPRDPVANAGMSALSANENTESQLKLLLNEQPDSPSLNCALGNHYSAQERWAEARQAYLQAYSHQPDDAGLVFRLAISLEHLGQKKLAARYYQSAIELDPSRSEGFDHAKLSQHIEELLY